MNTDHVISCGNGTDALQIAMMALGLKPGDEVITTNLHLLPQWKWFALLGLKHGVVDPDPRTYNISPEAVSKSHNFTYKSDRAGTSFWAMRDMESLIRLAKKHDLFIIRGCRSGNRS
jgi:dTDP-4-amino-4,6-dideoxygalactose transaminase